MLENKMVSLNVVGNVESGKLFFLDEGMENSI